MVIKSFLRQKVIKVYLIILSILITIAITLSSLTNYFSYIQNDIFQKNSKLIVVTEKDEYKNLVNIKEINNLKKALVFKENKSYNTFSDSKEDKIQWFTLETEKLKNYILVKPAKEFNLELSNDEIVIGLNSFWYDSYGNEIVNDLINQNIGFLYNNKNVEFSIKKVIPVDSSILIISDNLYKTMIKDQELYAYEGKIDSIKHEFLVNEKLKFIKDTESSAVSLSTFYKGDTSTEVCDLYDLLDLLTFISYIYLAILFIILIIIFKNILSDYKKNAILNRKIGYSNLKIKLETFKSLFLLFIFSIFISVFLYIIIICLSYLFFKINLLILNIQFLLNLFSLCTIIIAIICILKKYKLSSNF